ncbi:Hsp20/alpha crystallin family protein [Pseudonocardia halophobica]|uniref:Heat shock protein Hsp20 n=1 Tax=Pseudonocardia halophobica TaxID=29401 RepID=A0A9W6L407_9PSEU|nr:Hsp20/alpha crystallin family protein [Pseudonocardia halophobica]GLL12480.1 heat shock protein Hsp20 [Pseudonocardia halophobica]
MSTLIPRRDPFFADFDALVRRAFGPSPVRFARPESGFTPAADVTRDGADALVSLEVPGLDPATDVHVDVEEGRLVVHGERRDERNEESEGRRVREVRYGSFRRSFALPQHVTADAVSASYEAGVLKVRVAGAYAEPRKPGVTSIPVQVPTAGLPAQESPEASPESAEKGPEQE